MIKITTIPARPPFFVRFRGLIIVVLLLAAGARAYVYLNSADVGAGRTEPSVAELNEMVRKADQRAADNLAGRRPQSAGGSAASDPATTIFGGAVDAGANDVPAIEPRPRALYLRLSSGAVIHLEPRGSVTTAQLTALANDLRGACVGPVASTDPACAKTIATGADVWQTLGTCPPAVAAPAPAAAASVTAAKNTAPAALTRRAVPKNTRVIATSQLAASFGVAEEPPANSVADVRAVLFGGGECAAPTATPATRVTDAYVLLRESK